MLSRQVESLERLRDWQETWLYERYWLYKPNGRVCESIFRLYQLFSANSVKILLKILFFWVSKANWRLPRDHRWSQWILKVAPINIFQATTGWSDVWRVLRLQRKLFPVLLNSVKILRIRGIWSFCRYTDQNRRRTARNTSLTVRYHFLRIWIFFCGFR